MNKNDISDDEDVEVINNDDNKDEIDRKLFLNLKHMFDKEYIDADCFKNIAMKYRQIKISKGWHKQQELILKKIGEYSECYKFLHLYTSQRLRKLEDCITIPLISCSLCVSLFTLIANNFEDFIDPKILATISGGTSLIIGTCTGILKKWNLSKCISDHENYADMFCKLSNELRYQLSLPSEDRERMPLYLQNIVFKYHELDYSAPKIYSNHIKRFNEKNKNQISSLIEIGYHLPPDLSGMTPIDIYTNQETFDKSTDYDLKKVSFTHGHENIDVENNIKKDNNLKLFIT